MSLTSLVYGLIIIFILLIAWYVTKFLRKLVLISLVIILSSGYLFYRKLGPFEVKRSTITFYEEKYCHSKGDKDICDCIIGLAKNHIKNHAQDAFDIRQVFLATSGESLSCLEKKNAKIKYASFMKNMIGLDNTHWNDSIKTKIDKLNNQIENIRKN